jgi:hypothetical protein
MRQLCLLKRDRVVSSSVRPRRSALARAGRAALRGDPTAVKTGSYQSRGRCGRLRQETVPASAGGHPPGRPCCTAHPPGQGVRDSARLRRRAWTTAGRRFSAGLCGSRHHHFSVSPRNTGCAARTSTPSSADLPAPGLPVTTRRELPEPLSQSDRSPVQEMTGVERLVQPAQFLSPLVSIDSPTSSALTRERLGWLPTHPGLIADIEEGHYFKQ